MNVDELKKIRFEALRKDVQKGIDSLNRGEGKPLNVDAIKAEGRKRLAERRKKL
ncbi:MAG TPA: hypothetical protein VFC63_20505 [Blastocatellia bacterium]|nr:hypothetical protein [Blastocatellia bacterium]